MAQCQCNIYASYSILACRYNEVYIYSQVNTTKILSTLSTWPEQEKIDSGCWTNDFLWWRCNFRLQTHGHRQLQPKNIMWEQTIWWHCARKSACRVLKFLQVNKKRRARCGSVLRAKCLLLKLELFSTQLYEKPLWNFAQNMELKNWHHIMAQCQCNIYASYNILACRYNEVYIYTQMNTTKNPQHTLNLTLTRKNRQRLLKMIFVVTM